MPRKAKLTSKEKREKIQEKTLLSQEESNSLEQMIEKKGEDKMDISQFKEFLNEEKIEISLSSPSLKKINAPQRNPVMLERDIVAGAVSINNTNKEEEENGSFKYSPITQNTEEKKYFKYEGAILGAIIQKREIETLSPKNTFERREVKFEGSMQSRTPSLSTFEKYSPVAKLDKEKIEREKPFEKKEIKYTPEKY
ncbi:MAG: hypothetical protein NTZ83_02725 [Candidatus Pacearchaeota archaeon]|nr:hypothetical protein [Candidatus Pacearchaeota archaeon]